MPTSLRSSVTFLAGWLLLCGAPLRAEIKPEFEMFHDPALEQRQLQTAYPKRLSELWIEALGRPDADMQRMACDAIARGSRVGVPGLEKALPRLRELLAGEATHSAPRIAAARALAALDDRESAPVFAAAAEKHAGDLRWTCEQALGDWKFEKIRPEWSDRLNRPGVRHRDLIVAIRGLGLSGDSQSVPRLLELLQASSRPVEVRMESARALGRLRSSGLVEEAQKLLQSNSPKSLVNRLCAARLLSQLQEPEAHALLQSLATDPEPAVVAEALSALNEFDSRLVLPLAEGAMRSTDALVRRQGMRAYTRLPTPERVAAVVRLLDDPLPELRVEVRERIHELLSQPELQSAIWEQVRETLQQPGWRGQEQGALLVGEHKHKPFVDRLLELQWTPREEARIAAAWALRKLAIPETCPAILVRAEQLTKLRVSGRAPEGVDEQTAHLIEALAVMQYWQAEALWMQYVPKIPAMGDYSRGSAIWALGKRYNGASQPQLAALLIERLTDVEPMPPEVVLARYSSALTLGRIQAKEQIPRMVQFYGEGKLRTSEFPSLPGLAIRWALTEMTGETFPELKPVLQGKQGWFLETLDTELAP